MTYSVLVIDDEWNDPARWKGYCSFAEKSAEFTPSFGLAVEFLDNPLSLPAKIAAGSYDAVLLDVKLGRWHTSIRELLPSIGDTIPIALVSSHWDDTTSDDVNDAWERPNCKTFLQWNEVSHDKPQRALYQLAKIIAEYRKLDRNISTTPSQTLRVLHISDLQTGGFKPERTRLEAMRAAEEVLKHSGNTAPDFIAFTGDVAERGLPAEYDAATDWLMHFTGRLRFGDLPSNRLLVVPGNHDVCLPLVAAERLTLKTIPIDDRPSADRMEFGGPDISAAMKHFAPYGLRPYRDFVDGLCDRVYLGNTKAENAQSLPWVETRFRHLGLVFYGLNTAQPFNVAGFPNRTADSNSLASIAEAIDLALQDAPNRPLIIGLGHHCPISGDSDKSVSNPDVFGTFFGGKTKTAMFLHGHIHRSGIHYWSPGNFRLVLSCAATLTKTEAKRPPDSLRGFTLIELHRREHRVESVTASNFDWRGDELIKAKTSQFRAIGDGMLREARVARK